MAKTKAKRTKVKTAAHGAAKKSARPKTSAKSVSSAGRAAPKKAKPAASANSRSTSAAARDKYSQSGAPWWKAHL